MQSDGVQDLEATPRRLAHLKTPSANPVLVEGPAS